MTEFVGDGRITGWDIVPLTFPNVRVTKGSGFIDQVYVATFGDIDFELAANSAFNFYAQHRIGIVGTVGPRADVSSILYLDAGAPATPSGFSASVGTTDPSFTVDLSWTANTEVDLSHYELDRSLSVSNGFTTVATIDATKTTHVDTTDEDVTYFYRFYAIDESGFRSSAATDSTTTLLSTTLPPNPSVIQMPSSEGAINILWKRPQSIPFVNIKEWQLTHVQLKSDGSEISETEVQLSINKNDFNHRINNLLNGEIYKVTLQTVDTKDRESTGFTQNVTPQPSTAPKDPRILDVQQSQQVPDAIIVNLFWTDGADEYDPLIPHAYQIYVTVNGQQESAPIFTFDTDFQVELYNFGEATQFSIPEGELITFRITSLTENGIESSGSYTRFITNKIGVPLQIANLSSVFDPETSKITVTWTNQPDTDNVHIRVFDENLDGTYTGQIINQNIGLVDQFVFTAELNHRYTITVTPLDVNDVSGPSDITVEITLIAGGIDKPLPPTAVFAQNGDRQVRLTWEDSPSFTNASFRIYRKLGVINIVATDWVLLDTLPKTTKEFFDFGLDNDQVYSYYITGVDIYDQESLHLPDGAVNLNFVETVPKASGIITEPDNLQISLIDDDITLTWEALLEEFDAFVIFRSMGNLHSWEEIATVDKNTTTYVDLEVPLVDGTTFYYTVAKIINDSDIVVQISSVAPDNSIFLGKLSLGTDTFGVPDATDRRNLLNMVDPLGELTTKFLLTHVHREIERFDPTRIDLEPQLIVNDWVTVDARIFTTSVSDITGSGHIVKVDGRFPQTFFTIDTNTNRLIFSEPLATVNSDGEITGDLPDIEVRVLGVGEVQGILSNERFDKIHARQIAFGRIAKEQTPSINHEGRIRERMLPKNYLLERFSNHTFIVPEDNTDTTRTFGDGTTFYAIVESDGLIDEVIDFDLEDDGDLVAFREPDFSSTTLQNLAPTVFSHTFTDGDNTAIDVDFGNVWEQDPPELVFGDHLVGNFVNAYFRVPITIPKGSFIQSAKFTLTARDAVSGSPNIDIKLLDPTGYSNLTELSTGNAVALRLLDNISGQLPIRWDAPVTAIGVSVDTLDFSKLIQAFIDRSSYQPGDFAIFRFEDETPDPAGELWILDGANEPNQPVLVINTTDYVSEVTSDRSFQSEKSYHFRFEFTDNSPTRWVRVTTFDTPIKPNPILDLKKRLRFRILLETGSLYVSLGIRETNLTDVAVGNNGGTSGAVEWVGASDFLLNSDDEPTPIGKLITGRPNTWQEIEFDLERDNIINFEEGNNLLDGTLGVLEHLAFTIVPDSTNPEGPFDVFIDKLEQVDDVLAAGTSQGILVSRDFGSSWEAARLTETPVHTFYRAINNQFLWAISANEVLLSVDPANWFATNGLTGIQFIRDIVEDEFGNMFISTEQGVYFFEIALLTNFSSWVQTQPVNAFTTDCYGMYYNPVGSGLDEVWVSTELGIYKTVDQGAAWEDTGIDTQGLPAFQFMDISSDPTIQNIIAITRKHVLRKMGSEFAFSIIANFEVQHDIFDIWKMEFFDERLYVSTGKGVYMNSIDELFNASPVTALFERVFPGLDRNGTVGVAFGLDTVEIRKQGTDSEQLFIGQENRLMSSDETNLLSIKEQFPNKSLPSFFADNNELIIGYIYNAFNNVLSFRVPQPINKFYRAANLPRKIYLPINGGWAQTNPSADVFLFFNGIPKWLDFKLDEDSILSEVQALEGKLLPLRGTLTDFNSLIPDSDQFLNALLTDITTIKSGGESTNGDIPLINNTTITQFLADYTRFISLITEKVATDAQINILPKINLLGFSRSEREVISRAENLEDKEEFVANESTGIIIDTFSGEVDFLTIFNQTTDPEDRLEFTFDKFDRLDATIFNANVANIGELDHREIEDKMEGVNTGLTSHLSRAYYTNLIKAGIFFEQNHHFLFDVQNVTNIQSKFLGAHTSTWYDGLNSTIDYTSLVSIDNHPESRLANSVYLFTENPYLINKIWIGTDNDLIQFDFNDQTGELKLEDIIRPGNGVNPLFIWDIFVFSEDDIYVVAEEQNTEVGHIFRTNDAGESWSDLETINLPQRIYKFVILNGNKVVATENGIFYSDNDFGTWFPANLSLSPQLSGSSPVVPAFASRILNLDKSTFLVAEGGRWFFTSGSGIDWFAVSGQMGSNGTQIISKVLRFKNLTWIATDQGLYNDGNSILANTVQFGIQQIEGSASASQVSISDITNGADALYASGTSTVYRFFDTEWSKYEVDDIVGIHKIFVTELGNTSYLIIIAHNSIQVLNVTNGTGVFDA